jgi:hypothetical protein
MYTEMVCSAAKGNHVDILKWIYDAAPEVFPSLERCLFRQAVKYKNLDLLNWLTEIGLRDFSVAVCYMGFHTENKMPWNSDACFAAARSGNFENLKWLHENGCPWGKKVMISASIFGNFEIVKWLHENGCPWDDRFTLNPARRNTRDFSPKKTGHFKIIKYAFENGFLFPQPCLSVPSTIWVSSSGSKKKDT